MPMKVMGGEDRLEFFPSRWKTAGLAAAVIGFVVGGLALIIAGEGIAERAAGLLSVVVFGFFGGPALVGRARGTDSTAVTPDGVEIDLFGVTRVLIPWHEIEGFDSASLGKQSFTTVHLRDADTVISQIREEEEQAIVSRLRRVRGSGFVALPLMFYNIGGMPELIEELRRTGGVRTIADVIDVTRKQFGAEIAIPWVGRDRSASDFAVLLEQHRRRAGQGP